MANKPYNPYGGTPWSKASDDDENTATTPVPADEYDSNRDDFDAAHYEPGDMSEPDNDDHDPHWNGRIKLPRSTWNNQPHRRR